MGKLRERIEEKYATHSDFAKALGVSDSYVSRKLNGQRGWSPEVVYKAAELLQIPDEEIMSYFFTPRVAKKAKR